MPFHRFIDPTYFEAVPLPGPINLNTYDRINVISGGVGAGGSSPADSAKVGGPTPGTYFVAFGEDGTSLDANRGFRALAENADLLDDLLHRDLAVPQVALYDNVGATPSFTIVANDVFVGGGGVTNSDAGGLIGLVDDDGGSSQGQPLHVLTGGAYQAVKVTAITGVGTGYVDMPSITVSPAIPGGVAFKVIYYTRQSPASQPEDLVVNLRTLDGAWEADIWAFTRNILQTDQTFLGDINFAGSVTFSGPVSIPAGLQAPVVLQGVANFDALTINQVGTGSAFVINVDNTSSPAVSLLHIPATGTVNTAGAVFPSIDVSGRENLGAGTGGPAIGGTGGNPGGTGGVFEGGNPDGVGVRATSGSSGIGLYALGVGALSIGVDSEGVAYGVKGLVGSGGTAGVEGTATGTGLFGVGGLYTGNAAGFGVRGSTASVDPGSGGVYGTAVGGIGVVGASSGSAAGAMGGQFNGVNFGAIGSSNALAGIGVTGQSTGLNSTGVKGVGGVGGVGVWGKNSAGFGVFGEGGPGLAGVWGLSGTSGPGVLGTSSSGPGVKGESNTGIGVDGQGGTNTVGVRGTGGIGAGVSAYGVLGIGGGGTAPGVFGLGAIDGNGVTGQGQGVGSGLFGTGGGTGGAGAVGVGGGDAPGVVGAGVAGGDGPGVIGIGRGLAPGVSGSGGEVSNNLYLNSGSPGGVFGGGPGGHGVVGFPGDANETFGFAGLAGFGYSPNAIPPTPGQYGVIGIITSAGSMDFIETSGVRGAVGILQDTIEDAHSVNRSMFGGIFSGTSSDLEIGWTFKGGYGAKIEGSKTKADLRLPPRSGVDNGGGSSSPWTPLSGRVGDMFFHYDPVTPALSKGLCVCLVVVPGTGEAVWYNIPFGDWTQASISPFRDVRQPGTGPLA